MKRPEKVKIIGKVYALTFTTEAPLEADDMGDCDSNKQRIAVRDGQPLESEQDSVLHEIVHGIDDSMGIKLKEGQVEKIATGLLAVLKDNPPLAAYLRRKK